MRPNPGVQAPGGRPPRPPWPSPLPPLTPLPHEQWCIAAENPDPPPRAAVSQHSHSPSIGNGAGVGCNDVTPTVSSTVC